MSDIAGEFFGTYRRSDSLDQVADELEQAVDPYWERKYQADATRENGALIELELATCNMELIFYDRDSGVEAQVTPVVRDRSQTASYADFEESDHAFEQYLNRHFEQRPASQ